VRPRPRPSGPAAPAVPAAPVVSIVIPSYKPGESVLRCLDAIAVQTSRLPREVIVVDSSPEPVAPMIHARHPGVRVVQLPRRTLPGRARSIGGRMARGRVICFTDTDCLPDAAWLDRLWGALGDGYRVAGGSVANGTPASTVGTAEYLLEFNEINPGMPRREIGAVPSCNLAVSRPVFDAVGGFPDFMKGEDTIFCDRARAAGNPILFAPDARITHVNRTGFAHFLRNQTALGEGAAETRRRTRRHGHFLIRWPFLVVFIPAFRTAAIGLRFLRSDRRLFLGYLRLYPLIFMGLLWYTWGFIRGPHRSGLSTESPNGSRTQR
jgi:GT2 family glycosyltransferase